MSIIEKLVQGTEEWLNYRRGHIMATDASVIMKSNPFTTPKDLWEEKLGLKAPKELNDAMKRGQDLEEEARALFIQHTGIKMEPCVYESDKHSWAAASLDGLSDCKKIILEIKCPGLKTHEENIKGTIKDYYQTQMQHQLGCVQGDLVYFFSYRPEHETKFAMFTIEPDKEYIKHMFEKEKEFWLNMCTLTPPDWVFVPKGVPF